MKKWITFFLILFIRAYCFAQVTYNFESGNLAGWTQAPDSRWTASSAAPLNGTFSLRQSYDNPASSTDRISIHLPTWNPNGGTITWQVKVRHGYDPSGSNRWWINLMSNQDANQMQAGGTCSGYAVGVNLTGSDDLLKLWKIVNGTPQVLLSSTLDWQGLIGKSNTGAIEVERSKAGLFSLRASAAGSFFDLINYGNATDNSYTDFSYLGICYSYTAAADLLLWVDDISLSYNPNDITSEVIIPAAQIGSGNIISTSTSSTTAVDVMRFQIKDNATGDMLPTKVKALEIKKGFSANAANWVNSIGGVKLRGESGDVSILNQSVSADRINLSVDSTTFSILNGQTNEFTLSVFLKPTNLVDGSTLRFLIDSANHGFDAGLSGSDFVNTFSRKIFSNEFKIDVIATDLNVKQCPAGISKNKPFSLIAGGSDVAGNTDKEFSNDITLSLSQGNGLLTSASSLTRTPAQGISSWSDLQYNTSGTLKILATSTGVNQVMTDAIGVLNDSTTIVSNDAGQPAATGISSSKTYPASAVEVLRFRINDIGDSDGLPTIANCIKISRAEIADIISLTKAIGGILVKVNGKPIGISDPNIKTSYLTFTVNENSLIAPDGGFVDVSISIYLNESGLTDNQKVQLKVDATNHGFTAYPSGSKFNSSFPDQVISNIFWLDVVANQIKFSSIPTRVGVMQPFNATLTATDLNSNTDKDFSGSVSLSRLTGSGILAIPSGSTAQMAQGSHTFNALTYNIPEKFSLLASCQALNNIASQLITCGDSDGGVAAIASAADPVIINSTSTSSQNAVEVIKFNLFDAGTTDNLPLIPSKINLFCFDPKAAEQLNRQLGGFVVKVNSSAIDIESYSLSDGVFEIIPKVGRLVVADKDTVTLSVSIFLNKSTITDNFRFRFYIPSINHGWLSSSTGTGFASSFGASIYGPECGIHVYATQLKFNTIPFSTFPSSQFPVNVCATDAFGNTDTDHTDQLMLSLNNGTAQLSCSNANQTMASGYASWCDVSLSKTGVYRLKASSNYVGNVVSEEITCGIDRDCLIQEDFEGTINDTWLGSADWMLSTISPINGAKSLLQKQGTNAGVSSLAIPSTFPVFGDKLIEWAFTIKTGDWDPSQDNYFYFTLMADSPDLSSGNTSGFYIGINPSSGDDLISLWSSYQGIRKPIITSKYDWNANEVVKIKVGLATNGEWKLWVMPKTSQSFIFGGSGKSYNNTLMSWSGLVFGYTSSRSGQLWMDDLSICATDYPPILLSAKPLNLSTVKVLFSESINLANATSKSNYTIIDRDGASIDIGSISTSNEIPNGVFIKTEQLPFGKLMLKVNKINGLKGSSIRDSIYFGLSGSGSFGRLVVNEIMASPEPIVTLPSYEYIELYNPTSDTIALNGWKIQLNSYLLSLPNDTIRPDQYAVLCSTSAVSAFSVYGKSIGITGFPALINSGMILKIFDSGGSLISFVNYSDSWYDDDIKKNGGWSLEKIDYQNLMEGKGNWKVSISTAGGTPCGVNSVAKVNPDIIPPRLLSLEVISDKTVKLLFSEPMDSLMLTFNDSYNFDNGIGHPISSSLFGAEYNTAILLLADPLLPNVKYNLCLNQNITDFAGNHITAHCFTIALPQTPVWNDIVINEVLFNPYNGGVDFVEIFNRSDKTVDLSRLLLANRNSSTNQLDQVYTTSDTSKLLFPNDYAVITTCSGLVKKFYRTENEKAFINVSRMASFNNDMGHVILLTEELAIIDELCYSEQLHSKRLNDFKGISLERINPSLASSSTLSWQSAAQTVGFATPTYKNSQWVEPLVKDDSFTLSPEIFSPDGDGRDDYLLITYTLPVDGCTANISAFSSDGIEVKRIASNLLIGTQGTLAWDGFDSMNQRVPIGIYIIHIEYNNPKGEEYKLKKVCVVAEKL